MKKVILYCGLGMSTSMLVKKTKKEARARGIEDIEFIAAGNNEFAKLIQDQEVVLCMLGPQVRYLLKKTKDVANMYNIKVEVINPNDFCNINAKKILEQALSIMYT